MDSTPARVVISGLVIPVFGHIFLTPRARLKRKSDFVIRYGGDEFLIILPDTDLENAKYFASEVQDSIEKLEISGCNISLKVSFGLAELLSVAEQSSKSNQTLITTLIAIADKKLYKAKASGGNSIVD